MDDTTKTCAKCKKPLPATTEYFHANRGKKDGFNSWCKVCYGEYRQINQDKIAEKDREYRQNNKDKKSARGREYYQNNKTKSQEYNRKYYLENKDKIVESTREYARVNKDKLNEKRREYGRLYRQSNPEKSRINVLRRRARKRQLPDTFTEQQWIACLEYFGYACVVCGNEFGDATPHADHWLPLTSELCTGTVATNMICLCGSCNSSKNDTLPDIWLKERRGTRKANEVLAQVQTYFEWVIHLG